MTGDFAAVIRPPRQNRQFAVHATSSPDNEFQGFGVRHVREGKQPH